MARLALFSNGNFGLQVEVHSKNSLSERIKKFCRKYDVPRKICMLGLSDVKSFFDLIREWKQEDIGARHVD